MENEQQVDILLVEDNPNDAELTLRALNKYKLANALFWVKDGEEALDFLFGKGRYAGRSDEGAPKLILLDLKLPKVDGIEVLRHVKADRRLQRVPVVALTSSAEECDLIDTYSLGVNSYIVKPVDFQKFIETVAQIDFYWLLLNRAPT